MSNSCSMCNGLGFLQSPFGQSSCPLCQGEVVKQGKGRKAPQHNSPQELVDLYEQGAKDNGLRF